MQKQGKLLLIMPKFFDYPEVIEEELSELGYEVDFFDDRPSTNGWIKALIRIDKNLIKRYIRNYFDSIMRIVKTKKYDVVFLISGQSLSFDKEMIEEIKACQPDAKFVLYQWDSVENFPYIEHVQECFDKCYSFDRRDVERNSRLKFLPLFYSKRYENIGKLNVKEYEYDFCFIGTAHPKKYKSISMMSDQLKSVYPKQFIYFFFPSRLVFFYRKVMNKELQHAKINDFHYMPLSGKQMDDIYIRSRCVLDSAQDGQFGLTIRVLEALGAKKKLITTNEEVINYDFYCPENIYVYTGEIDLGDVFFTKPYRELDSAIYESYSIRSWLTEILS